MNYCFFLIGIMAWAYALYISKELLLILNHFSVHVSPSWTSCIFSALYWSYFSRNGGSCSITDSVSVQIKIPPKTSLNLVWFVLGVQLVAIYGLVR